MQFLLRQGPVALIRILLDIIYFGIFFLQCAVVFLINHTNAHMDFIANVHRVRQRQAAAHTGIANIRIPGILPMCKERRIVCHRFIISAVPGRNCRVLLGGHYLRTKKVACRLVQHRAGRYLKIHLVCIRVCCVHPPVLTICVVPPSSKRDRIAKQVRGSRICPFIENAHAVFCGCLYLQRIGRTHNAAVTRFDRCL